ncbi:MAG: hypothetical protein Q7S43_02250 [bacterium]|nr:hypothetical protein [bacterium]
MKTKYTKIKPKKDKLIDNAIVAIEEWGDACKARGERPACLVHFMSVIPGKKEFLTMFGTLGEKSEMVDLVEFTNAILGLKDGEEPLL